jgi:cytochrome o ubiquinol oxidase subunit 1
VQGEEAYWHIKQRSRERRDAAQAEATIDYRDIHMPRNSATGFICAFFATLMGFALIWHIWWLVAVGFVCAYATFVVFAWRDVQEDTIPAGQVAQQDRAHRAAWHGAMAPGAAAA